MMTLKILESAFSAMIWFYSVFIHIMPLQTVLFLMFKIFFFTQIYLLSPVCSQISFVASYCFGSDLVNLAESKSYYKEPLRLCFEVQVQLHSAVVHLCSSVYLNGKAKAGSYTLNTPLGTEQSRNHR